MFPHINIIIEDRLKNKSADLIVSKSELWIHLAVCARVKACLDRS